MTEPARWIGKGKVRARREGGALEITVDSVTTQARYYKPLVYEFFRVEFPMRPRWGDVHVHLRLEHAGEAPRLDLDNLAKAMLDALKGRVFFDDVQVARLLCERVGAERDRIWARLTWVEDEAGENDRVLS
jgi:Holliday junction resolvase RusA-like endonuclease